MSFRKLPPSERNQIISSPMKQIRSRSLALTQEGQQIKNGQLQEIICLSQRIQEIAEIYNQKERDCQMEICIERENIGIELKRAYDMNYQKDQECQKMVRDIHDFQNQIGDLNQQNQELRKINQEQIYQIQQLSQSYHKLEDDHQICLKKLNDQAIELNRLQEDNNTWMNKFQHLDQGHQVHLDEMRKQFELEQRNVIDMEIQKWNQKNYHDWNERLRQEQNKYNELQCLINNIEEERNQIFEESRRKDDDIEEMRQEIEALQKIELDNRKMCAHIEFLESKFQSLVQNGQKNRKYGEEQRQKLSHKERLMQEQIGRLQQERDHLDQVRGGLEEKNQGLLNELHSIEQQIQSVKVQNEEYQTNIKLLQEDVHNLQIYRQKYHQLQQSIR